MQEGTPRATASVDPCPDRPREANNEGVGVTVVADQLVEFPLVAPQLIREEGAVTAGCNSGI